MIFDQKITANASYQASKPMPPRKVVKIEVWLGSQYELQIEEVLVVGEFWSKFLEFLVLFNFHVFISNYSVNQI